jgi:Winged helix DNA-binding domain
MEGLSREQLTAFRLARQGLSVRSPRESLLGVAAMGLQNSPPTSALLSLGARVDGLQPGDLDRELTSTKNLLQIWSLRAAPYVVATPDLPVFTTGLLPESEADCLFILRGASDHLTRFMMGAGEAVAKTVEALPAVMADGATRTKDELGVALANRLARRLPSELRDAWGSPDGIGRNTYGQSLVRYALEVVSLHGTICFGPPTAGGAARFALTEAWLGHRSRRVPPSIARAELVRRFLEYLGPSDPASFARWAGVSPSFARASWDMIEDELVVVRLDRKTLWLLAGDAGALETSRSPNGWRLLPPHDPYLASHDRATIAPDEQMWARIWRSSGNPGVALADGEIVGLWHPRKTGGKLAVRIEALTRLSRPDREGLADEASALASLRNATLASVTFEVA